MRLVQLPVLLLVLGLGQCGGSGGPGRVAGEDATAALERAIEEAGSGTVALAGSDTYVVREVTVRRSGITLECTGSPPATIRLATLPAGDSAPILDVRAHDFTLRNCILDGNRAAQPQGGFSDAFRGRAFRAGVRVDGAYQRLTVEGVTFRNVYGAAIATRNARAITVERNTFEDGNFEAVFATNDFELGDPSNYLEGFTFVGNTARNLGSGDARVNANGLLVHQMADLRVEDNEWVGYERTAIKIENCRHGTIAHNRIRGGSIPNFAAITMQNGADDLTVRDNDLRDVGTGIDASLVAGGQYPSDDLVRVIIRDNTVRGVKPGETADGIRILGYGPRTAEVTISGNTIENIPRRGITVRQFRTYHDDPEFFRITVKDNQLRRAGSCSDWFEGSEVVPSEVTDTGNRCE